MTEPGWVQPVSPGWWVRKDKVGVLAHRYGWGTVVTGTSSPVAILEDQYGWSHVLTGYKPVVTYGHTGAGQYDATGQPSWSHVASANEYVVVAVSAYGAGAVTGVTYGGSAMTLLGYKPFFDNTAYGFSAMYGFLDATGGTRTVAVTRTGTNPAVGGSVSYKNVKSVRCVTDQTGSGTTITHAVGQLPIESMIVHMFGADNALTPSGGTSRYTNGGGGFVDINISDATANTTFSATSTAHWAGLSVILTPVPVGSTLYVKGVTCSSFQTSGVVAVDIPPHASGDLIVLYAYRQDSTTTPTKPAASGSVPAWVDIDNNTGANTNSSRTVYFVATGTNTHTSGAWTGAYGMVAVVLAGQKASGFIGGHAESGSASTHGATAPSITLGQSNGTSKILHFFGRQVSGSQGTWNAAAPANYTRFGAIDNGASLSGVCVAIKNVSTTDGAVTYDTDTTASLGYRGATVEVLD